MNFFVVGCASCEVVYKGDELCNHDSFVQWTGLSQALRSEIIHWRFLDTIILQKWHLTQTQVYDKIEVL